MSQKQPEARRLKGDKEKNECLAYARWNDLMRFERLKILHSDASFFVGQVKELIIVLSKSANAS